MKVFFKKIWDNGPLLIIIAAVLWALDGVIRRSLYSLQPIIIVFYEHLIGSVILIPFILKKLLKEKFTNKELLVLAFVALLSGLFGTLWFTTALLKTNFISFSVVFLLQKLQPIFAVTTAVIFLKEMVSSKYLIWAALAMIAAYFVTFKDGIINFQTGSETIIAALYALGAAFAWGSSTTFSKIALIKKDNNVVTGLRFLFTTLFAFIFILFTGSITFITQVNPSDIFRFVLIALSTGMVAVLIYYRGLKQTQVKVSTILELTFPILAIFIDALLYHSYLSATQLLAAAVLLFSIYKLSVLQLKKQI